MPLKLNASETFATTAAQPAQEPIGFSQRLLAEAVRLHEDAQGLAGDDPQADALARAAGGDLERRLVTRARALAMAPALSVALRQLRGASRWAVAIGLVMAIMAGATTAQVALGSQGEGPVNFFWVLGSLLGVHTLALLIWLMLMLLWPGAMTTGSLGGMALALGRRISRWLHREPVQVAAVRASASIYARNPIGRWTLSAISHSLWLAFLSGCLVLVIFILSTKQYTFAWETTILSDRTYVALTRTLASAPAALGFTTPTAQQIMASHWTRQGPVAGESREAWSGLLVGSLVAYGLLPRSLLLIFSLLAVQRAGRRFRLDMSLPGYARLRPRLLPEAQDIGIVDADTGVANGQREEGGGQPLPIKAAGPLVILGLEIEPPQTHWPPLLQGVEWLDLGFVDSRGDRQRALEQIRAAAIPPRAIAVVCSLAATPDRGTRSFIHDLQTASHIPVVVVLTEGQRLRLRGDAEQVAARIEDWRRLLHTTQVPGERVIEVDLDHLTDASRARLASLFGVAGLVPVPVGRLARSCTLIMEHIERWPGQPSLDEQAELHRAIAILYRGEGQSWQALLRARFQDGGNRVEQLKSSAERMVNLLPARLRANPRWLAAGAMAGALGCVAAATLVAPAAIAALPAWAGLGAALAAVIQPSSAIATPPVDLTTVVRSAALFAVLLELQGRDEVAITRIIDQVTLADDDSIVNRAAAREWLNALQQRLALALVAEGSS